APKEVRTEPPAADLDWFSALLESEKSFQKSDFSRIKSSSTKSRLYMLSILTLSRPEDSLSYFEEFKPNDDEESKMQTLARQMKPQTGDLETEDPRLEKSLQAIKVPAKPESQMQIAKIAEEVRALRIPVAKGIKGKSEAYAKRVLSTAVKLEEDVSRS